MSKMIGVIGSLGIEGLSVMASSEPSTLHTQHGTVPAIRGTIAGIPAVQITRSGGEELAAHAINHRANIAALAAAGVTHVVSTGMVGGLDPQLSVGDLVLVDQFIDFTRQHELTYFTDTKFRDMDFTDPYCPHLRQSLLNAAAELGVSLVPRGCYVSVDGPRFETRAEVKMYRMLGGDVIGMTGLPECIMAREAGMCFATIAGVVNPAAGLSTSALEAQDFMEARGQSIKKIAVLVYQYAAALSEGRTATATGYCCNRTPEVIA